MSLKTPDQFLEEIVKSTEGIISVSSFCAGFEGGSWRAKQLADYIFSWIPYAALSQEKQLEFGMHNFMEMLKLSASHIYNTKKTQSRGEIGELLLHIACVAHFGTFPILCKLVLKSASNDTVKGFDGVHILQQKDDFEIWLGESKFYQNGKAAIKDAVESVKSHIIPTFITSEKAMILGHIAENIPHRDEVIKLFKSQTSGDYLLKKAVFPILIAYDSAVLGKHNKMCEEYKNELLQELDSLKSDFAKDFGEINFKFHLIFIPLNKKIDLLTHFDKSLEVFK